MIWLLCALILLVGVLSFFEGLRRSGRLVDAKHWLLILGLAAPLVLGAYVWRVQRHDCTPTPPMMDMDLSNADMRTRYDTLVEAKETVSQWLKNCGGSPLRWDFYLNLETLVKDLEDALDRELLEQN